MVNLSQKRKLSAALKQLHGKDWSEETSPRYDDLGLAKLYVHRFSDVAAIEEIVQTPVSWLQIEVRKNTKRADAERGISLFVRGVSSHLKFLQIDYIFDCSAKKPDELRNILPGNNGLFKGLQDIDRVVFNRININDNHVRDLCTNQTLTNVDIRECDVTKGCIKWFKRCPNLQFLQFQRCHSIPLELQPWLERQLPRLRVARVK